MMIWLSVYQLISRGIEAGADSSIAARIGVYAGLAAYAIAWGRQAVTIDWKRWRCHTQKLLLPEAQQQRQDAESDQQQQKPDDGEETANDR